MYVRYQCANCQVWWRSDIARQPQRKGSMFLFVLFVSLSRLVWFSEPGFSEPNLLQPPNFFDPISSLAAIIPEIILGNICANQLTKYLS